MVEAEGNVSIGFFGVEDSDRDGATVIESEITESAAAGVTIRGEGIGAKGLLIVGEGLCGRSF